MCQALNWVLGKELWAGEKSPALTELTLTANSIPQLIIIVKTVTNETYRAL